MGWLDDAKTTSILSIEHINFGKLFNYFKEIDNSMEAKIKINKSLSARVRRRNISGFKDEGTHVTFKKDSFGDYRDVSQNHKNTDTVEHKNLVRHYGYVHIGKHPGSKPMRNLYNA